MRIDMNKNLLYLSLILLSTVSYSLFFTVSLQLFNGLSLNIFNRVFIFEMLI